MCRTALLLVALAPSLAAAAIPDITGVNFGDAAITDATPYLPFLRSAPVERDLVRCLSKQRSVVLLAHVARDGSLLGLGYEGARTPDVDCALRAAMEWSWPATSGERRAVVLRFEFVAGKAMTGTTQVDATSTNMDALPIGALFADGTGLFDAPLQNQGLAEAAGLGTGLRSAPGKSQAPVTRDRVVPGQPRGSGALDTVTMSKIVRRNRARIDHCWELSARRGERPGRGVLKLSVDAKGFVVKAALEVEGAPELKACVESKARHVRFPASGGASTFEQGFVFTPAE